jgi:hypothetical protein
MLCKFVQLAAHLLDIPAARVKSAGKRRLAVKARSMVSYWTPKELRLSRTEFARESGLSKASICADVKIDNRSSKRTNLHSFKTCKLICVLGLHDW